MFHTFPIKVDRHKNELDSRISSHHDNCSNLLFREEITLEQYRGDLKQLCDQIERILSMKDCVEMVQNNKSNQISVYSTHKFLQVQLMKPLAKRLEKISEQIMGTGENILNRLQFVPRRISNSSIPGIRFLKNFFYNSFSF